MGTNINNYTDQLNDIAKLISTFANNPALIGRLADYEKWLTTQLQKTRDLRANSEPFGFFGLAVENTKENSLLLFDSTFHVTEFSGAFTHFMSPGFQPGEVFSPHDLIADSKQADFFSNLKLASANNRKYTFLTVLKDSGYHYKTTLEIEPAAEKGAFRMAMSKPEAIQSSWSNADAHTALIENLSGVECFLCDHRYRFVMVAGNEKEKYGRNAQTTGKVLFEAFEESMQKRLYPFLHKALNGQANQGEVQYSGKVFSVDAAPVKDESGFTIAATLIVRNITEDVRMRKELRKTELEAEAAEKEKALFLANISHEIRTPLNAIIGFSEQMDRTNLDERQSRYNHFIKKASDHLLYMVNEVVFLFKLDTGKAYIEKKSFSLAELLAEISGHFSMKASEKQIDFEIITEEGIPKHLISDPHKIKQILQNLLTNAFKFTESGKISLTCKLLKQKKAGVTLEFTVSDTGIGISEEELPHIFEIFGQVDQEKYNRGESGLGLGLGICLKLVNILDGEISVTSALNQGTEFKVTLPFKIANQKKGVPDEAS